MKENDASFARKKKVFKVWFPSMKLQLYSNGVARVRLEGGTVGNDEEYVLFGGDVVSNVVREEEVVGLLGILKLSQGRCKENAMRGRACIVDIVCRMIKLPYCTF